MTVQSRLISNSPTEESQKPQDFKDAVKSTKALNPFTLKPDSEERPRLNKR